MTESKFNGVYYGETNLGIVRTNNEDTYICQLIWDNSHILCAAIDGLGGYEGGEIAAELARSTIIKHLEDFASKKIGDLLKAALIDANNEIIRHHKSRPRVSQMGCVASVGVIDLEQGIISIAHVGDSRIYQFVNGELKKLTHDHSLVGYREETGELSEEDAMNHPKRNVIDKFLGEQHLSYDSEGYLEVSVWPITGETQYLFCSDGLTDLVSSIKISHILSSDITIEDKVKRLITEANNAGGKDNITVVIADITSNKSNDDINVSEEIKLTEDIQHKSKSSKSFIKSIFFIFIGLIIGLGSSFAYNSYKRSISKYDMSSELDKVNELNIQLTKRIQELEDSLNKLMLYSPDYTYRLNGNSVNMVNESNNNHNSER